jgi:anthranilate/para-aminobenzoate synthase component II
VFLAKLRELTGAPQPDAPCGPDDGDRAGGNTDPARRGLLLVAKLVGICFGHYAMAKAFGGDVVMEADAPD